MTDIITKPGHELAKQIIKEFEGLRLKAYRDVVGVPTIGWGTTHYEGGQPVSMRDEISEQRAEQLLDHDMHKFEEGIKKHITADLSDEMDAALISFTYNLGLGAFYHSTLLRKLNEGDLIGAAHEFGKWTHAGGKVVSGLVRRRKQEQDLFEKGLRS